MSTRSERQEAAKLRRLTWRTRWAELAKGKLRAGVSMDLCARAVADDANKMAQACPQMKTEIIRAANEFMTKLAAAIVAAGSEAYQQKHSST